MQRPAQTRQMDQLGTAKPPQYPIKAVDNALRLLLLLGERSEVRLTEASVYLDVASSTAHRLLSMLQYRGFVRQDPISKAYLPGPALTGVAFAVFARMDIPRIAAPILRQLSDALQETVHIGMLDGTSVRFIAALESPSAVRVVSRLGRTMPAHCTSTGKAMSNCQYLWIGVFQATSVPVGVAGLSAGSGGVMSTGRSSSLPLWNTAPARTRATRCGAFTARQRACAASMSL